MIILDVMLRKIVRKITNHVKVQDIIFGQPLQGTYADYLLLIDSYKEIDPMPKNPKKADKFKQMLFNTKFLQYMLKTHGELHCEYCGKKELRLYHWKKDEVKSHHDMATADHFHPKAKYPELAKEFSNLKVCCYKCNQDKKDDEWDKLTLKFAY
jgi:5-methylcytosine-specific restriction endonuclease McrA